MSIYITSAILAFAPAAVFAQYGVQATASPTETPTSSVASPTPTPQEAQVDYFLKIDGVEGESKDSTPTPTPQENQSTGVEPEEIDYDGGDGSTEAKESGEKSGTEDINIGVGELAPDFSILFESDGDEKSDEGGNPDRPVVEGILLEGMQDEGLPVEHISLNFERIRTTVRQEVRLLGFIPVGTTADVDIDSEGRVKVRFPWWAFLATGIESDDLGSRISSTLSDVLKAKHDTVMNAIRNLK